MLAMQGQNQCKAQVAQHMAVIAEEMLTEEIGLAGGSINQLHQAAKFGV